MVGFLIVFRSGQAYNRFWEACTSTYRVHAEWLDAASSLLAFCKYSDAPENLVIDFQEILVRLFSLLHAMALAELEEVSSQTTGKRAWGSDLLDCEGLDGESLVALRESESKVTLVLQWIQLLVVENISNGVLSIPSPILTRSFNELANGVVAFHDALRISQIPFPFPYTQMCECLLIMHWCVTPVIVPQWANTYTSTFTLSFTQVFILWCLNYIAMVVEGPFGYDRNNLDSQVMQQELNRHLLLLIHPGTKRTPDCGDSTTCTRGSINANRKSINQVWNSMFDSGRLDRNSKNEVVGRGSLTQEKEQEKEVSVPTVEPSPNSPPETAAPKFSVSQV